MIQERRGYLVVCLFFYVSLLAVVASLAIEVLFKAHPCSLCFLQRLAFLLAAFAFAVAMEGFYQRALRAAYLFLVFGFAVALKHSLFCFFRKSSCSPILFSFSMPYWSFALFCFLLGGSIITMVLCKKIDKRLQKRKIIMVALFSLATAASCLYWRAAAF